MSLEQKAIANGWGKWGQAGVPHKGWSCVDQFDAFERYGEGEYQTCEMCEKMQIRAIHVMSHRRYPETLECGCICSGHMEEDLAGAETRNESIKSRIRKRTNSPKLKGWKLSAKGNPYINLDGFNIVVSKQQGYHKVGIKPVGDGKHLWGSRRYQDIDSAKRGAYDALAHIKSKS